MLKTSIFRIFFFTMDIYIYASILNETYTTTMDIHACILEALTPPWISMLGF